jgi:uncharacterized repeat protein (TIGR01451 family)
MKQLLNRNRLLLASISLIALLAAVAQEATKQGASSVENETPLKRMEYFHQQRAFPFKTVPRGARSRAVQQLDRMLASQMATQPIILRGNPWTLIGADPVAGFWGHNSGRVSAFAVDPTNSLTAYLGAADGGVWKTTDGGTSWSAKTDQQPSLSSGAIAIAPSNPSIIYYGTGEEDFSGDSYSGAGILKSTDGGSTWSQLAGPFVGSYVGSLAVNPTNSNIVLAAVEFGGIYRSADGGVTWTKVLAGTAGTKVAFDPAGSTAYAAMGWIFGAAENGIYESVDGGITWSSANGGCIRLRCGLLPVANAGRITFAMAASSPSTLYAVLQDKNNIGGFLGVYKTTNGGSFWFRLGSAPADFCTNCWYNLALAVAPNNANVVFGGGSGKIYRSLDGGSTWGDVTLGTHPDLHALAFDNTGATLYIGNDGGVWKSTNPAGSFGWTNLNGTLADLQYYTGLSIQASNASIGFAGTQDNSLEKYTGALLWTSVTCGDGGYSAIDFAAPSTVYADCEQISVQKSTSSGASWVSAQNGINTADRVIWIPPLVMDPSQALTLYFGTYRVYQTTNGASSWAAISPDLTSGSDISTIAVHPVNSSTVWSGSSDGKVYVTTNASAGIGAVWTDRSAGLPVRFVSRIAGDPHNSTTAYVALAGFLSGHIFKTVNNGVTWTNINGNLPDIPVNDLIVDPVLAKTLYVATDIGVFQTSNGGTTWSVLGVGTFGIGLPRSFVLGLGLHNGTRTLRAATHGRSMWDIHLPIADLVTRMVESPNPIPHNTNATYTITVHNNGPDAATGTILTDVVPNGTTFQSASTSVGTCTTPPVNGTGTVKCSAGTLASGASLTVTIVIQDTLGAGSTITDTASASSSTPDTNKKNNAASLNTPVS